MITEPICGTTWYLRHRYDHTQAEIDALGIEVKVNGKTQFKTDSSMKSAKGVIKNLVRLNRERR